MRFIRRLMLVTLLGPLGMAARAQGVTQQGSSPIDDLLRRALNSFNDLKYTDADSVARLAISAPTATTNQRTLGRLIIAASLYPEGEARAQKRDSALLVLRQVIRTNLDIKIPRDLTWPGLDSLFEDAKRTGYGINASLDSEQVVVGSDLAQVNVRSNHASYFHLTVATTTGTTVVTDSTAAPVSQAVLHFPTMRNGQPLFSSGDYDLLIVGRDAQGGDSIAVRHVVHIDAPSLQLATPPASLDTNQLLKERSGGFRAKGILAAIFVGGATFALSSTMRADSVKNTVSADSKGMPIAAALAGAIVLASYADHGRPIPSAIAANQRTRANFAQQVQSIATENRQRVASYRTTITMQKGVR